MKTKPVKNSSAGLIGPAYEKRVVAALRGLLRIARIAMFDVRFATDPRVRRAQKLLVMLGRKEVR